MAIIKVTPQELTELARFLEKVSGIVIPPNKAYLVESRLSKRLVENGMKSFRELVDLLKRNPPKPLVDKIVDAMTTNETLWFRDSGIWEIMRDEIIPDLDRRIPARRIRIWSAACSTGQEPYSISMLIHRRHKEKRIAGPPSRYEIVATDISMSALFLAKVGRYDRISMSRGFTGQWATYKDEFFKTTGNTAQISNEIKDIVHFQRFNLSDPLTSLGKFDLVLIRNVAIYFSLDFKKELFRKIYNAMNPGGYLILGASESLRGISSDFKLVTRPRGFYYTKV